MKDSNITRIAMLTSSSRTNSLKKIKSKNQQNRISGPSVLQRSIHHSNGLTKFNHRSWCASVARVAQKVARSASEYDNGLFKLEVIWNSTIAFFFYNTNTLKKDCSLDKQSFEMNMNINIKRHKMPSKGYVGHSEKLFKQKMTFSSHFPLIHTVCFPSCCWNEQFKRKGCKLLDERKEIISYVIPLFKAPQG